jgi:effector-binding domain-containing protein
MKALKYILFLVLIAIIAVSIYAAIQPSQYDVQRTRILNVPQAVVYNNIIDYKNWSEWGPWQEEDPSMVYEYPEKTSGVGGSYSWTGKDGAGSMETLNAKPYSYVEQKIMFEGYDPSTVYWNFENTDSKTKVTWGMKGDKNFMFKLYTLYAGSMDEIVGPMYERGLEKLDSLLSEEVLKYNIEVHGITQHGGGYYLYKSTSTKISDVPKISQKLMLEVQNFALKNKITAAGAPFIIYHKWDEQNDAVILSTCFPTADRVITTGETDILTGELKPFTALKTTLTGDYVNLQKAWNEAMEYVKQNNLNEDINGPYLEVYTTDLKKNPNPSEWITEIYIPVIASE